MRVREKQKVNDPKRSQWIVNYFKGHDVFIVGGGPSLYKFDFSRLDGKRVIAVNHSYRYCKPEILVFLDGKFKTEVMRDFGHDLYTMPFKIIAGPSSCMKNQGNCTLVYMSPRPSNDHSRLHGRAQSGLVAINAALIGAAKNIYLLGFDGCFIDGRGHFYSDEWKHTQDGNEKQYSKMNDKYNAFRAYRNIYNCSEQSKITAFKKIDINEVLR
jgi:hypothetical protein